MNWDNNITMVLSRLKPGDPRYDHDRIYNKMQQLSEKLITPT